MKKIGLKVTTVALALGIAAAGISPASASGTLAGGGATFQADFQSKCLARFNTAGTSVNQSINVTYAGVGSGAGRTGLGDGTYKFAGSDSKGTSGTLTAANSVWFPVTVAPLVIMVNLKSATNAKITALRLDAATLNAIFTPNGITRWNDAAIVALNPGVRLPDKAITVVTRSDKSGSTGNFKSYLKANVPNSSVTAGNEYALEWASGVQVSGSPALVTAVGAEDGRIGYADLSDVTSSVVKVSVKNKYGQFILPSATAAANYIKATGVLTTDTGTSVTTNGGLYNVDFAVSVKDAYQLSFVTYMVGNKSLNNTDFKVYANYVLNKCAPNPTSITATGYTTIGATLIAVAKAQVAKL